MTGAVVGGGGCGRLRQPDIQPHLTSWVDVSPLVKGLGSLKLRVFQIGQSGWSTRRLTGLPAFLRDFDHSKDVKSGCPTSSRAIRLNPWTEGPVCWVLANPCPLPQPVQFRGAQLLFEVPDGLISTM